MSWRVTWGYIFKSVIPGNSAYSRKCRPMFCYQGAYLATDVNVLIACACRLCCWVTYFACAPDITLSVGLLCFYVWSFSLCLICRLGRIVAKNTASVCRIRPSVRLPASINAAPIARLNVKSVFYIYIWNICLTGFNAYLSTAYVRRKQRTYFVLSIKCVYFDIISLFWITILILSLCLTLVKERPPPEITFSIMCSYYLMMANQTGRNMS
jgi:hypothetical protein